MQPEAQDYAEYLRFWSPLNFYEFRTSISKNTAFQSGSFSGYNRIFVCFHDISAFREDARLWFRKISLLPTSVQDKYLDQLGEAIKDKTLKHYDPMHGLKRWHVFIYNMEVAFIRKKSADLHKTEG